MDIESLRGAFFEDAYEHLGHFEEAILTLEKNTGDAEQINAAFRAVHTIKGSGGIFPFGGLLDFAHDIESFLESIREQKLRVRPELITLLFEALDHLNHLVKYYQGGAVGAVSGNLAALSSTLNIRCKQYLAEPERISQVPKNACAFIIQLKPDILRLGLSIEPALSYLLAQGQIASIHMDPLSVPDLEHFQVHEGFLRLRLVFKPLLGADEARAMLNDAFEMVLSYLEITAEETQPLPVPLQVLQNPEVKRESPHAHLHMVKVEGARLESLLNLMGEIAMRDGTLRRTLQDKKMKALAKPFLELSRLIDNARDLTLQLRMISVAGLFRKVERIARDAAHKTGREVQVKFSGKETELDRVLIDKLHDPLVHIVRNAVDHGIEDTEERIQHGKPGQGEIFLAATQIAGAVEIIISDDGRGLDGKKILAKALERGLAQPSKKYSESEILNFIFEPGFSTRENVSQISGRGVGMDVVRRNIESVRGTVSIESKSGIGTQLRLRLPVTLALIDGFLVNAGGGKFLIPLEAMKECIDFSGAGKARAAHSADFMDLRGEVLPYLRLSDFFNLPKTAEKRESLIVIELAEARFGLLIDEPLGKCQVVVKSFTGFLAGSRGISGASMLGVGDIALVLDLAGIYSGIKGKQVA